jgi:hypothetical protein
MNFTVLHREAACVGAIPGWERVRGGGGVGHLATVLPPAYIPMKSRDSSVGIELGYGLEDRGSRVRFPAEAGNFSLHHLVQNSSGAHPAS